MTKRFSGWTAAMIVLMGLTGSAQESVRSSHPGIASLIARANTQSRTFRSLSDAVNASDGIVYIEPGICGHGVGACLTGVTTSGYNRFLWVRVDIRKGDADLIASIGHELRHTIEVLGNPTITTSAAIYLFYHREGVVRGSGAFETRAATEAGRAVRAEIQKYARESLIPNP